jgi:hypothetical protein
VDLRRLPHNVIVAVVLVVAVILAALVAGRQRSGEGGSRPAVAFGPQVQPTVAAAVNYTNGWAASSGSALVGVYAGAQRANYRNGVLLIARVTGGHRHLRTLVLHGSGAVTLLRPPVPVSETAAFSATLHLVTASGSTGTLDLSGDGISLSH